MACRCDTDQVYREGRCEKHAAMMKEIHRAWNSAPGPVMEAIWAQSDGYGVVGMIPIQGYDWSGIRDSTVPAVESMYEVVRHA